MRFVTSAAAISIAWLISGCDAPRSQAPADSGRADRPSASAGHGAGPEPAQRRALHEGWNVLAGGGDTVCSDGSSYRFFVRPADPDRLVIYFQGGGACWFGANCDPHLDPSYKPQVASDEMQRYRGIFQFDNPENPFRNYSFVVVPYCTADVHLGNNLATYQAPEREATADTAGHDAHPVTIHHNGLVNARAVLDWTYQHFAPEEIFVTGSSAGAIPSPYYAWQIAEQYPDARIAQLGDAAGGYRRSGSTNLARMEQWRTLEQLRQYPEFADIPLEQFRYEDLYIAAARRFPGITFAEYDAAEDAVQKRFLAMGGSETAGLKDLLLANHADIRAEVDNFRAYVAGGDSHTILGRPEFYTFQVNGVRIRDWVAKLAAFEDVPDVTCQTCERPELVEGRAPNDGGR